MRETSACSSTERHVALRKLAASASAKGIGTLPAPALLPRRQCKSGPSRCCRAMTRSLAQSAAARSATSCGDPMPEAVKVKSRCCKAVAIASPEAVQLPNITPRVSWTRRAARNALPFVAMRYSIFSLLRQTLSRHRGWTPAWRDAAPKPGYDVVIVGGGGHGLAAAYYLAKVHGITNVAVLEKSWIGSGNAGRNTTIIRSNYLLPGNNPFYEWSMKLWEGLERDLNYNVMVSQRGVLNLHHSDLQRDAFARRGNAMRRHGVDAELLDRNHVQALGPYLHFANARFPISAALLQRRGGTARHDAVVWGYARA